MVFHRDSQASMSEASVVTLMTTSTCADRTLLNGVDLASLATPSKTPSEDEHLILPNKLSPSSAVNVALDSQTDTMADTNADTRPDTGADITNESTRNRQAPLKCSIDSGVTSIADKSTKGFIFEQLIHLHYYP